MTVAELTLRVLFLLLPGLVACLIVEKLTVHKPWTQFRFLLHSFAFGIASYAILDVLWRIGAWVVSLLIAIGDPARSLRLWSAIADETVPIPAFEVILAVIVAIPLAFLVTKAIHKKWLHSIARRLDVSDKYGDESLYYFFLNSKDVQWVTVRVKSEDLTYEGFRESMSEDANSRELLLRQVAVYRSSTAVKLYELDAAYLSLTLADTIIEKHHEQQTESKNET